MLPYVIYPALSIYMIWLSKPQTMDTVSNFQAGVSWPQIPTINLSVPVASKHIFYLSIHDSEIVNVQISRS